MSAATCFYHPDQVASAVCAQCAVPLCPACTETVANKPVCRNCVSAIRARLGSQMNAPSAQSVAPTGAQQYGTWPPPPAHPVSPASVKTAGGADTGRLLLGILAAAVVGIVGTIIWEKIFFYGHFGLSLIYLGIGIGVAWVLVQVSGQHTGMTAPLAVAITLVTLAVGHLVLAYDFTGVMSWDALMFVCSHLGPMHWICVALGLFGAYRTIDRGAG